MAHKERGSVALHMGDHDKLNPIGAHFLVALIHTALSDIDATQMNVPTPQQINVETNHWLLRVARDAHYSQRASINNANNKKVVE
jgi:hypothetical protein